MNRFEEFLISYAYECYSKTGSSYVEFQPKNSEELYYYSQAAECLDDEKLINPFSENIGTDSISLLDPEGTLLCYDLTDAGLQFAKENFKRQN